MSRFLDSRLKLVTDTFPGTIVEDAPTMGKRKTWLGAKKATPKIEPTVAAIKRDAEAKVKAKKTKRRAVNDNQGSLFD